MLPTFNDAGDIVLLERLSTKFNTLERGDVVVAKSATNPDNTVCKRIRAMVSFIPSPQHGKCMCTLKGGDTVKVTSYYGSATTCKVFWYMLIYEFLCSSKIFVVVSGPRRLCMVRRGQSIKLHGF
jgi:hypothetical protein